MSPQTALAQNGPDLSVKLEHIGNFAPGRKGLVRLTVANVGDADAPGFGAMYVAPSQFTIDSVHSSSESSICTSAPGAKTILTCTEPEILSPGSSVSYDVQVNVKQGALGHAQSSFSAFMLGDVAEANMSNNMMIETIVLGDDLHESVLADNETGVPSPDHFAHWAQQMSARPPTAGRRRSSLGITRVDSTVSGGSALSDSTRDPRVLSMDGDSFQLDHAAANQAAAANSGATGAAKTEEAG